VVFVLACGGKVSPAPQPFRPEPGPDEGGGPEPSPAGPADCGPMVETTETKFHDREIPAGEQLAQQGEQELTAARGSAGQSYEQGVTSAVETLLQALSFDPYNVDATYTLAQAYALIDRPQCSLNLIQRVIYMRSHPSKKRAVEKRLDQMLGRGGKHLDPAFEKLWGTPAWNDMVDSICKRDEKDCVYGK
jgi:hypothetical protein